MADQSRVEALLSPYLTSLRDIVLGAWTDWMDSGYSGVWRCKRTRAGFIWEQMTCRAHVEFSFDLHVRIHRQNESFLFVLGDELLFRFKRSDERGYTRNYPTQAAIEFHDPEQPTLPGLDSLSRVEVSYVLNEAETSVEDILVVARNGNRVAWKYSVLDRLDSSQVVEMPDAPVAPVAPKPEHRRSLVRVKSAALDRTPAEKT
ncbi:hypothetical protein ACCQ13_14750 [Xanthomonas sp. NCPPB 1638]|uniref:hypothetical protein n=1 Tax=Xanthomonas TaxID=338 RepID=UPI00132F13F3|nr:hypothetical protein [Xanthomonas cucurbitae]QHG87947.1 hypothetical protein EBN15_14400 [Xanthomonas cucurbitae]